MKYDSKGEVTIQLSWLDQNAGPDSSSTTSVILTPVKNVEVDVKETGVVFIDKTPDPKIVSI